jgi:hypothetical protein
VDDRVASGAVRGQHSSNSAGTWLPKARCLSPGQPSAECPPHIRVDDGMTKRILTDDDRDAHVSRAEAAKSWR